MNRRFLSLLLVGLAFMALACAKKLSDLQPYPCATDSSCPDGLACGPESTCVTATIDAVCRAGETDCTAATPGGRCALGACGQPCDGNRQECPAGRVCSVSPGAGGAGGCLRGCSSDGDCPPSLRCRVLDSREGKNILACLGPTAVSSIGGSCEDTPDCTAQGASLECINGVCTRRCSTTSECGAGYLCPPGGGGCLRDCSTSVTCEADQVCKPLWTGGQRACMSPTAQVSACDRVEVIDNCTGLCGNPLDQVNCSNGVSTCPSEATCGTGNRCTCPGGIAYHCDGKPCSTENPCNDGNAWCVPNQAPSCSSGIGKVQARCKCKDGRSLATDCGSTSSCEARCQDECDLVKQDCLDPARQKCANITEGETQYHRCVALATQPKKEGEACSREAGTEAGSDECAKGLFCSLVRYGGETVCRRFCEPGVTGAGCKATDICVSFFPSNTEGDAGLCRPRCTMPNGPECGPNAKCINGGCYAFNGTGALGAACYLDVACQVGMACLRNRCVPYCNSNNPCPAGYRCGLTAPQPDAGDAKFGLCVKE